MLGLLLLNYCKWLMCDFITTLHSLAHEIKSEDVYEEFFEH